MYVVKHGSTHRNETCDKCRCKFEYNEIDINRDSKRYDKYVKCPECGHIIWLWF